MRSFIPGLLVSVLMMTSLSPSFAHAAEPSDAVKIAREHFLRGRAAYESERYEEALEEFRAGYLLAPRPEFLLNFVQTYRKLRRLDEAVNECERFLASSRESRFVPEARALLETLKREQLTTPPPVEAVDVAPLKSDTSKRRKKTLAIVLGTLGGLAVAGVAIGVGVGLGAPSNGLPSSMLGTHPFGLH